MPNVVYLFTTENNINGKFWYQLRQYRPWQQVGMTICNGETEVSRFASLYNSDTDDLQNLLSSSLSKGHIFREVAISSFYVKLLTDKQTNARYYITSLAELTINKGHSSTISEFYLP